MELSQGASMLPFWLQRTAERAQFQAQAQIADHISVRRETCRVETQDGFKVLKCEEIREVFRCAADGCVWLFSGVSNNLSGPFASVDELTSLAACLVPSISQA
jgi:hypothetical protein